MIEFIANEKGLKALFKKLAIAMSTDDTRYYLKSVFLEKVGDEINWVATDGHKAVIINALDNMDCVVSFEQKTVPDFAFVIPRRAVDDFIKLSGKSSFDVVKISINKDTIIFDDCDVIKTYKLVDGIFPEWRRVVPQDTKPVVAFNRKYLAQVARTLSGRETLIFERAENGISSDCCVINTNVGVKYILMPVRI